MSRSVLQGLMDIYLAPAQLFQALTRYKGWSWFALLLILLVQFVAYYLFFSGFSTESIVEQKLEYIPSDMSSSEVEQARGLLEQFADKIFIVSAVVFTLGLLLALSLMAVYALIIGNRREKRQYRDWFAFNVWAAMPLLVNSLGFIALILMSQDRVLPLNSANYLSVNQLVLGLVPGDRWFGWAESLNLTYLWCALIAAIGFRIWSGFSLFKSCVIALLPLVVVFGIWASLV